MLFANHYFHLQWPFTPRVCTQYTAVHQSSEKVTYNFGVKLMGPSRQHLVNGRWVFVDDKSEASV